MKNIERYYEARRLKNSGLTLRAVGLKMGLSGTRIREMIIRVNKMEAREEREKKNPGLIPWYRPLSEKTKRELNRVGLYSSKREDFKIWGSSEFRMYHGKALHPEEVIQDEDNRWVHNKRRLSLDALNELRLLLGFPPYVPPIHNPSPKEIIRAIRILDKAGYGAVKRE